MNSTSLIIVAHLSEINIRVLQCPERSPGHRRLNGGRVFRRTVVLDAEGAIYDPHVGLYEAIHMTNSGMLTAGSSLESCAVCIRRMFRNINDLKSSPFEL